MRHSSPSGSRAVPTLDVSRSLMGRWLIFCGVVRWPSGIRRHVPFLWRVGTWFVPVVFWSCFGCVCDCVYVYVCVCLFVDCIVFVV